MHLQVISKVIVHEPECNQQETFSQSFAHSNANGYSFDGNLLQSLAIKRQLFDLKMFIFFLFFWKNTPLSVLPTFVQLF
jgi:hypothetical protein